MANSLGTLTLDLIAKIGGFTGPLDKASAESKKRTAEIAKAFDNMAKGIGLAVGAVPAILTGIVVSTANSAKEISNLASVAGLSTTEFQKLAAGAATVGIEQDKLADIFKDTNDKLGDFLNNNAGGMKDFFTNIAPLVGVTAENFKKLNSADALALYVTSLQKANVSQAEMTFYMEAIASDSTALVPLLANNAKGFTELGDAAAAAGAILSEDTIQSSKDFGAELVGLEQYVTAAKIALSAEFLPVLVQFSKDVRKSTTDAGGLKNQMEGLGETLVNIGAGVASTADVIVRLFNVTANTLVGLALTAIGRTQLLAGQVTSILALLPGETGDDFAKKAESFASDGRAALYAAAEAAKAIREDFEKPLAGDSFREYVKNAKAAASAARELTAPVTGGGSGVVAQTEAQKKAAQQAAAAAKKIDDAFKTTEEGYQRQIALINTTADASKNATEVAKLQFEIESGKLVGINALQQERLLGLAAELDALEKTKKAAEENIKLAAFKANLDAANQSVRDGFAQELAGAGSGDKLKERLKADLAIEQDFNKQREALFEQYNSKDITEEQYNNETALLEEALAERLVLQQDYYNQLDDAQSNWLDGVTSAWENYKDTASDYQQQAADATGQILGDTTDKVAESIDGLLKGTMDVGDATKNVILGIANSVVAALEQMLAQWLVVQTTQLIFGKATAAQGAIALVANAQATAFQASLAAFASTAAIPIVGPILAPAAAASAAAFAAPLVAGVSTAALAGQAHDGIDSVPADGTWNLQKGERVTTSETSAKLDKTLDDVQKNKNGKDKATTVNLIEDASKAGQTRTRLDDDGMQEVIDVWISRLFTDDDVMTALNRKTGLRGVGE